MKTGRLFTLILIAVGIMAACVPAAAEQQISLYYYNPALDLDASGNILCSEAGLVAVERTLPSALSGEELIQATIELLLAGELTAEESGEGMTTEFPLEGFLLTDVTLSDGVATLSFDDPNFATSGGACRVAVLWAQIEETALQFEGVEQVRYQPADLFQP